MAAVISRAARVTEVDVVTYLVEDYHIVVRVVVVRGPAQVNVSVEIVPLRPCRAFARGPVQCQIQRRRMTGQVLNIGLGELSHIEDVECPGHSTGGCLNWH